MNGPDPEGTARRIGRSHHFQYCARSVGLHLALVLVPSGAGYLLNQWIFATTAIDPPTFYGGISAGVGALWFCAASAYTSTWTRVFDRISGTTTDFLVFSGWRPSKCPWCWNMRWPLVLLLLCGILVSGRRC